MNPASELGSKLLRYVNKQIKKWHMHICLVFVHEREQASVNKFNYFSATCQKHLKKLYVIEVHYKRGIVSRRYGITRHTPGRQYVNRYIYVGKT